MAKSIRNYKQGGDYRINFEGLRSAWRNPSLSRGAKVVLFDLLLYAGVDGISFPSQETLATNHGFKSSRHVKNLLSELKDAGSISWTRGGYGISNKYSFSEEIYFPNGKDNRKSTSSKLGNTQPVDSGNTIPPKKVSESIQLSSSHEELLQLFETANKEGVSEIEKRKFETLCNNNPREAVENAIKKAISRHKTKFNTAYLSLIIGDVKEYGEAPPKPVFHPCGLAGCENGYILNTETQAYRECQCMGSFRIELQEWRNKWE